MLALTPGLVQPPEARLCPADIPVRVQDQPGKHTAMIRSVDTAGLQDEAGAPITQPVADRRAAAAARVRRRP